MILFWVGCIAILSHMWLHTGCKSKKKKKNQDRMQEADTDSGYSSRLRALSRTRVLK